MGVPSRTDITPTPKEASLTFPPTRPRSQAGRGPWELRGSHTSEPGPGTPLLEVQARPRLLRPRHSARSSSFLLRPDRPRSEMNRSSRCLPGPLTVTPALGAAGTARVWGGACALRDDLEPGGAAGGARQVPGAGTRSLWALPRPALRERAH